MGFIFAGNQNQDRHENESLAQISGQVRWLQPRREDHEQGRDEQNPKVLLELDDMLHVDALLVGQCETHDRDGQQSRLVLNRVGSREGSHNEHQRHGVLQVRAVRLVADADDVAREEGERARAVLRGGAAV